MPRFSFLVAVLAVSLWSAPVAFAAQAATPAVSDSAFGDATGLPELRITATDIAFEGVPETTAAGRYLITFVNTASDPEGAGVHFMHLPEGMTLDTLMAPPTDAEAASNDWFYEVYQAGGAIALPGQTAQVILDLVPGDFVVWGGFPSLPQVPVTMTVTGDATASPAADAWEPDADLTVTELRTDDGGFAFQLDGTLTAGVNVVKIVNQTDQPHFFFIERYPEQITLEQVQEFLMFDLSAGTPPPGMLDESLLEPQISAATQSAGTTQWLAVTLEPGSHIISCFVEDSELGGMPHAFEGMLDVIQVGAAATTAP